MLRLVDPMLLQFGVDRLREAGFLETNHLRASDPKKLLQIRRDVILHNRVMREVSQNLRPAIFRNVASDQDEVQFAFAAPQGLAPGEENARPQDEWKHSLH